MPRKPKAATDATGAIPAGPAEAPAPAARARDVLKKKDFLDLTVARAGLRKADARLAIDATLATLAAALSSGQDLVLPPLGKLRVIREKQTGQGRTLMLRLVLDTPPGDDAEPLAARDDHG